MVNSTDVGQTKAQVGVAVTSANFRNDINASGTMTSTDVGQVKALVGNSVP